MSRVYIVEDEPALAAELCHLFQKAGQETKQLLSFVQPLTDILAYQPDLLLLDLNLPGQSGFELCRQLKARAGFPVLVLTARDTLADELKALNLGADDYITKPFRPERLLARALRLLDTYCQLGHLLHASGLTLDLDTYKLVYRDGFVLLPETEGQLMQALMSACPEPLTRAALARQVWGQSDYIDLNILPVNIARLRRSLARLDAADRLETIRGLGYRLRGAGK
ncbi:MAG: response regulator transcription factor [Oscillospiraceae bacterium]|nr:response regulator transcription factor [Oscillospiraceae bacterium]MDD4368487.1 response regulator transcription factor [Oscillospiraceae bacterium]